MNSRSSRPTTRSSNQSLSTPNIINRRSSNRRPSNSNRRSSNRRSSNRRLSRSNRGSSIGNQRSTIGDNNLLNLNNETNESNLDTVNDSGINLDTVNDSEINLNNALSDNESANNDNQRLVINNQRSVINNQRSVINNQRSVISDESFVNDNQRSVISNEVSRIERHLDIQWNLLCQDYELEPIEGGKSTTWSHFGRLVSVNGEIPHYMVNRRVCGDCLNTKTYLSEVHHYQMNTGLTNLKRHLWNVHRQLSDDETLPIKISDFNVSLTIKCCLDYSSFNSIQNYGFINLIKLIRPDIKIPTPNHLVQNILPKIYNQFKEFIKNYINQQFKFGQLSFDIWIDNFFCKSYICFNLFFLNNNLDLIDVLLDVIEIKPPHDRFNILSQLRSVINEYNIDESKLTFIIDAGANVTSALRTGNLNFLHCAAHGLHNLVIKDSIKRNTTEFDTSEYDVEEQNPDELSQNTNRTNQNLNESDYFDDLSNQVDDPLNQVDNPSSQIERVLNLDQLILKLKRVVSKINRNKNLFQTTQERLINEVEQIYNELQLDERFTLQPPSPTRQGVIKLSLKKECVTRWNTLNESIKSISKNVKSINEVLIELGAIFLIITSEEEIIIQNLIKHLDEVEKFTKMCCKIQILNGSFILAAINLKKFFKETDDSLYDNQTKSFRIRFRANFNRRIKVGKHHLIAFLLDPQLKRSNVLNEYLLEHTSDGQASTLLYNELNTSGLNNEISNSAESISNRSNRSNRRGILEGIENENQMNYEIDADILAEINSYLNSQRQDIEPKDYWITRKDSNLYNLFLKYGCIQLTTIRSEQTWSKSSLLNSKKRAKMLSINLTSCIFINFNYSLCEKLELTGIE